MNEAPRNSIEHRARLDEIGAWSTMNANLQSHLLAAKAAGLDPERSVIPWGSSHTVNHIQQQAVSGLATKLALAGLTGLGLGAGGLTLASLAGLVNNGPGPRAETQPVQYEWVLDVERSHDISGKLSESPAIGSGRSGSAPSTRSGSGATP